MHAKNVSVLHLPDGTSQLAPMYDVVPQLHQPFDHDFAFSINGRFDHGTITRDDLVAEGAAWKLRTSSSIVDSVIASIAEFAADERPLPGAHHALAEDITRFCLNLSDGKGASAHSAPKSSGMRPVPESDGGWGGPVRR